MKHDSFNHEDGSDTDFDLKDKHSVTDLHCCVLFAVALVAFGALYRKVVQSGDIGKLYHGIDYRGRVCGVDAGVQDSPFLYWCAVQGSGGKMKFETGKPICVENCPDGSILSPVYDVQPECALVSGSLAQMVPYKTIVLLHRYCIPDVNNERGATQKVTAQLQDVQTNMQEALSSLPSAWPVLLGAFVFSVVLGYVYLVMLRHCAEYLIWSSIVGSIAGCVLLGVFLWTNADTIVQSVANSSPVVAAELADVKGNEAQAAKIGAVLCWAVAGGLACLAQCLHHSIHVASACVEVACEAIFDMPSLLLAPLSKVLVKGLTFLALVYGFLLLWSSSDMTTGQDGVMRHFSPEQEQQAYMAFYVIMALWILAFINAVYQFMVAYAVVEYYYTPYDTYGKKETECCAMLEGLRMAICCHAGSLAFGSLLIALLTVLQMVLEWAERKNRETGHNHIVSIVLCCLSCLVNCCKDMLSRVNRAAYIEMAISSSNFCESAQRALGILASIAMSLGILTGATVIFTIFGIILIALGGSWFAYAMASSNAFADEASKYHVDSPVLVTWIAAVIGALVAGSFMNIFDVASDTMLYCYQTDRQSGKGGHTAPHGLRELMGG